MLAGGIMVGPMNKAALAVPFILAVKSDCIAELQADKARGNIDIMRNQQGLPAVEAQDETLMPVTVDIIAE